jgi:hypothetical protein
LRVPIDIDLILRARPDSQRILRDGALLSGVAESSARRYCVFPLNLMLKIVVHYR